MVTQEDGELGNHKGMLFLCFKKCYVLTDHVASLTSPLVHEFKLHCCIVVIMGIFIYLYIFFVCSGPYCIDLRIFFRVNSIMLTIGGRISTETTHGPTV